MQIQRTLLIATSCALLLPHFLMYPEQHVLSSSSSDQQTGRNVLSYPPDPIADILWSAGVNGVSDILSAFNDARSAENNQLGTSIPMLTLPSQSVWNNMTDGERALWLINRERTDRGIIPLDDIEANVTGIAQYYANYLLDNNVWGHYEDGYSPWERLNNNPTIGACHDYLSVAENLTVFVTTADNIKLPIERSVFMWLYTDKDSSWGHRHAILWDSYNDNSGIGGKEGFLGIGRSNGGPYKGPFSQPWPYAEIIVMNIFDPCSAWDYMEPYVTIITRADANPTSSASVDFEVIFSEAVTGVDKTDFSLTTTGVIGAFVSSVIGSGDTYTATVKTGTGNGTIRLDVVDNDSIKDAFNNPLGGVGAGNGDFTSGEVYDIVFKTWYGGVSITSNRNVVAVGRPHVGAEVATYTGFTSGSTNAYIPMLFKNAFDGSYDSALYVENLDSSNTANITIRFYDNSGNETYTMPDTIQPLASKGYWLPAISALGSSWVGGVKVESDRNIVAVGRPHVGSQVMTYNGFASGSPNVYIPMLFKDAFGGSYDSALYIQNVDPSNTANITIRFYDSSGTETYSMPDTLSPLASKGYWLPAIAPLGSSWVGGVKVESDQDIIAVGRPHIGSQVLTYNGFTSGALNAYVPMMFKDAFGGSYDSALYVQNLDPTNTANITIRFYDNSGTETYSTTDSISALASKGYWLPAIAPLGTSWVGGVKVESDHDIVAVGRPHVGSQVMAYNGFVSGSVNAYVPMLFRDAFGGSYDSALYVQNVSGGTANVTIKFYDTDGNLSCTVNDSISALASKGWWLPGLNCPP